MLRNLRNFAKFLIFRGGGGNFEGESFKYLEKILRNLRNFAKFRIFRGGGGNFEGERNFGIPGGSSECIHIRRISAAAAKIADFRGISETPETVLELFIFSLPIRSAAAAKIAKFRGISETPETVLEVFIFSFPISSAAAAKVAEFRKFRRHF